MKINFNFEVEKEELTNIILADTLKESMYLNKKLTAQMIETFTEELKEVLKECNHK